MKTLGISIYPGNATIKQIKDYINMAARYGVKRIFTCLISQENRSIDEIINEFKEITTLANNLGIIVIADVEPEVFNKLDITYRNLNKFKDLGLQGIRLDIGFTGLEESIMSYTDDFKIELNMSNGTRFIDNIVSYKSNLENLLGCHNFYPHKYTGLSYEHFIKCSKQFKSLGIRTAAFINSHNAKYGPWPVSEGLCTLEDHRELPIDIQCKHLFATGLIDDVIIANMFASEEELSKISKINKEMLELNVNLVKNIPELERKIVVDELHFNRGDVSDYMIRSTQSRVKYKGCDFPVFNSAPIRRGDILIESDLYLRYAGELQIALKDMENSGKTNVVGRIVENEIFLLDYLEPWSKFKLKEA